MNLFKKLLIVNSIVSFTLLSASTLEYPSLYKDTRIMGMGGTNVAVGGEGSSLFYNPAGLSSMKYYEGLEVELLNLSATFSENTFGFLDDMGNVGDDSQKLADTLEKYQGQNNHVTVNDYSSISYRGTNLAWSFGVVGGAQLNFKTHAVGSAEGVIDLNGYVLAAVVGGLSYDFTDELHIGLGYKQLMGSGGEKQLTLSEAQNFDGSNMDQYFTDISSSGYDLGVIYDLEGVVPFGSLLAPSVGVSIMDIGGTKLGNYGSIPQTINLGVVLRPNLPFLSDWTFAADYMDLTDALDANYDANFDKRLRMGMQASLLNNSFLQLTGKFGWYNADTTFGVEARLAFLTVNFAVYTEELGAYAGQDRDRRTTLSLIMGW